MARTPFAPGRYTIGLPTSDPANIHIKDATEAAIEDEFDMSARSVLNYLRTRAPKRGVVITDHTVGEVFRNNRNLRDFVFSTDLDRKNNPRRRSKAPTVAQRNAARAMRMFHSGQADSLAEAWAMIRRGR